ncbi:MAG: chemotaxis protein CheW [Hydrogenoanaerobacterium sp.]
MSNVTMNTNLDTDEIDDLAGKYLTFYIANAVYGVELLHVLEIISIQGITTVPSTPVYVKGIINLRGRIVPVLDVRLKFGQEEKEYDERTCIIVINIDEMMVGLIVDSVSEVVDFSGDALSNLPSFSNVNQNKYIKSISKAADKLVLNLDCKTFLQDDATEVVF